MTEIVLPLIAIQEISLNGKNEDLKNKAPSPATVAAIVETDINSNDITPADETKIIPGINDFYHSKSAEPHVLRRKAILAKHPEIEQLYGHDSRPAKFGVLLVMAQVLLASYAKRMSWPTFLLVGWILGGAMSHSLSLLSHELSHNLLFASPNANIFFSIFCNLGTGIPSSTTFKKYHLEHHLYQGTEGMDVDVPTAFEGRLFNTPLKKFLFLLIQSLTYSLRPMFIRPKVMNTLDVINYIAVIGFDLILIYWFGIASFYYLVYSLLMGMGLHPVAGHFIGEHYIFNQDDQHETYSYYGSLNLICWNVGYHNEHHDFPRIPGWRLPEVTKIAPEFYCDLPQHKSWTNVLIRFIFDQNVTPFSRVTRQKNIRHHKDD